MIKVNNSRLNNIISSVEYDEMEILSPIKKKGEDINYMNNDNENIINFNPSLPRRKNLLSAQ